jgi:hypothetical protein
MNKKLVPALGAYAILMILAVYLLTGKVLAMVLILLAALLAKTLIAVQKQALEARERENEATENDPQA